jgi:hypothetical protein
MTTEHDPPPAGWHLKREIQLGHIVTTLTVAFSVSWYVSKLEQRIAMVEQQIAAQHERDERQDKASAEALVLIRQQLDRLDSKIDRVLDRVYSGKQQ